MDRQLIDYLPPFIQNYAEIKQIMNAEQPDIEGLWSSVEGVMNDQFVTEASENGVKRWESILDITPKGTYTLEERKFNVLVRLNEQLPYTIDTLKTSLESLCGADGYVLKLDPNAYDLIVKLALKNDNNVETVRILLDKILPANIVKHVVTFNNHKLLKEFTHGQLAAYTHQELIEEIL